jgi:hypothetical protein
MSTTSFWLIDELATAGDTFATAASDPVSAVLIVVGAALPAATSLAFGGLAAAAAIDAIGDAVSTSPPPSHSD